MRPTPKTEQISNDRTKKERVTVDEASAILGVSARTIQRMTNSGKLPTAAKIGRIWTYNEQALRDWVSSQEEKHMRRIDNMPRRTHPVAPMQNTIRRNTPINAGDLNDTRKAIRDLRDLAKRKAAEDRKRKI